MPSLRNRRYNYLITNGFFPNEAQQLSRTSRAGMKAPYFRTMVKSRRRLFDNAKRYKWSETKYRNYVRQLYINNGWITPDVLGRKRVDVWAMLRYYEERAFRRGEEYESPWKKRLQKKGEKKRQVKRTTRRDMLRSWIAQIDRSIERTRSEYRQRQLQTQRDRLQNQLDTIKE